MKSFFKKLMQKNKQVNDTEEQEKKTSPSENVENTLALEEQKRLFQAAYGGQCGVCTFAKLVSTSKDSHFIMCSHPQLPKYQGQPVLNCRFVNFREGVKD